MRGGPKIREIVPFKHQNMSNRLRNFTEILDPRLGSFLVWIWKICILLKKFKSYYNRQQSFASQCQLQ